MKKLINNINGNEFYDMSDVVMPNNSPAEKSACIECNCVGKLVCTECSVYQDQLDEKNDLEYKRLSPACKICY